MSSLAQVATIDLNKTERVRKSNTVAWQKRVINVANILFVLIWAASLLPSRYAVEMKIGLKDFKAFGAVLLIIEAIFIISNGLEKRNRAQRDIVGFVYAFLFIWEVGVSRLNLLPFAFVPAPENVFYVFIEDYINILEGFRSSMILIILGVFLALFFAVILGTLVGWVPRLTNAIFRWSRLYQRFRR